MARFDTSGLDDVLADMKRHGELIGETADKMLMAGAEEVKKAWESAIELDDLIDTGDMLKSIGYANAPRTAADIRLIDIYPQGKDRKGVRNAEKAFINHYGTSGSGGKGVEATHFVDVADELSADFVIEAYERIWEEFLTKGN